MKKLLLLLLFIPSVMALSVQITPDSTSLIYPEVKQVKTTLLFDVGIIDDIEDLDFTLTVTGPAVLLDGTKETSGTIAVIEDDTSFNYTLLIAETSGKDVVNNIVLRASGVYISNAFVGGGKKKFNVSKNISVITTGSSAAVAEVKELQQVYDECVAELADCNADIEKSAGEVQNLLQKRGELEQDIAALENELATAKKPLYITIAILAGIIAILVIVIVIMSKKPKIPPRPAPIHPQPPMQ